MEIWKKDHVAYRTCAYTLISPGQWWEVDLGGTYTVGYVSITNRKGDYGKCM